MGVDFIVMLTFTLALLLAQAPSPQEVMSRMAHGEGTLKPGDPAPDFSLRAVRSDKTVRLSGFAGQRPVALVFGSYT
jgi:hypothetical protein